MTPVVIIIALFCGFFSATHVVWSTMGWDHGPFHTFRGTEAVLIRYRLDVRYRSPYRLIRWLFFIGWLFYNTIMQHHSSVVYCYRVMTRKEYNEQKYLSHLNRYDLFTSDGYLYLGRVTIRRSLPSYLLYCRETPCSIHPTLPICASFPQPLHPSAPLVSPQDGSQDGTTAD